MDQINKLQNLFEINPNCQNVLKHPFFTSVHLQLVPHVGFVDFQHHLMSSQQTSLSCTFDILTLYLAVTKKNSDFEKLPSIQTTYPTSLMTVIMPLLLNCANFCKLLRTLANQSVLHLCKSKYASLSRLNRARLKRLFLVH